MNESVYIRLILNVRVNESEFIVYYILKTRSSQFSLFFSGVYLMNKPVKNNSVLKLAAAFEYSPVGNSG